MAWDTSSVTIGRSTKKADYDRLRMNDQAIASGTFTFYGAKTWKAAQVYDAAVKFNAGVTGTCTFRGACKFNAKATFTATSIFNSRLKANNRSDFSGSFNVVGTATITGKVIPSLGVALSGYIHTASTTANSVFDTLSPYLPNVNDVMPISGSINYWTGSAFKMLVVSRAIKGTSNSITFYGVVVSSEGITSYQITDGSSQEIQNVSIAW